MTDPVAAAARAQAGYERAARRYGRLHARVERFSSRLAGVRLAAFLVAAGAGFAAWHDREWLYAGVAAAALVTYVVAAWLHRAPFAYGPRLAAMAEICREGAARITGDWDALPDDGADALDPARPELKELLVFGRGSLYQLVNRCALPAGRARVAELLRDGVAPEALPGRQAAAQELAALPGLRRRIEAEGRLAAVDAQALASFLTWAEAPATPGRLKPLVLLAALLVPATLVQLVLTLGWEIETLWQVTFLAQVGLYAWTTRRISADYLPLLADRHRPFLALRRMFERLERRTFHADALAPAQARFGGAAQKPSVRMGRLEGIVESLAVRHSALLYAVVSLGLCWELVQGWRLERWRAEAGRLVRADLETLADVEALSALGGFAADHPTYRWPTVHTDGALPAIEAEAAGYPLFPAARRVANTFTLERGGQLVLITGSNMSGKSSFLRALGANVLLAQAGAPVCAEGWRHRACRLSTSIQITDDPGGGLSRFYAEVKRIRSVLAAVEGAEQDPSAWPRLFMVDEMLSGTNSRERHLASRFIVARLLAATRSFGLVTTHDLDLVRVADGEAERVPLYHFSDRFDGERLHFDYTLKPGRATTTNALHVLRMEGIDVPPDAA